MKCYVSLFSLAIVYLVSVMPVYAQQADDQNTLDSFISSLDTISGAEQQLAAIVKFSYVQRFSKSIFPLTIKARQIAQQSGDKELIAAGLEYTANYHQYNFKLDSSALYYQNALSQAPF